MKLERHRPIRRPRAAEVIQKPETEERFDAAQIITRVIRVANERLGGAEKLKVSRESAVLVFLTHPELAEALFPDPKELKQKLRRQLAATANPEDQLMEVFINRFVDKSDSKKLTPNEVRSIAEKVSKAFSETLTSGESPTHYLLRATLLACLFPESRDELASVVAMTQAETLDRIDSNILDPNYKATASGGMLRLLSPNSALPLQELTDKHGAAWEEELRDSISPKMLSSYTSRGLHFYLDRALKMAAGLEIMLAKEAKISDTGEVVIVPDKPLQQAEAALPDRNLAA